VKQSFTECAPASGGYRRWLRLGLLLGAEACTEKDPFAFCEEDRASQMLRPSGNLTATFLQFDVEAPLQPFRAYVQPFEDGSVHLAACQLDEYGRPWHIRTRWRGLQTDITEHTQTFEHTSNPQLVRMEGFIKACRDEDCAKFSEFLGIISLQHTEVWLDRYSKSLGFMAGGIVKPIPEGDGPERTFLEVYFDLKWDPPQPSGSP
jgi:hypothetical protein